MFICIWEDGTWCELEDIDTKDLKSNFKLVNVDTDFNNPHMNQVHDLFRTLTEAMRSLEQ